MLSVRYFNTYKYKQHIAAMCSISVSIFTEEFHIIPPESITGLYILLLDQFWYVSINIALF
jgi:hypothetical protein